MGQGMRKDLLKRLCEAHEAGSCLFAQSPSEAHRLRDAYRRGDLISPAPRVYALPELWTQLKPIEQERHRLRALGQLHPDWVFASFSAAAAACSFPAGLAIADSVLRLYGCGTEDLANKVGIIRSRSKNSWRHRDGFARRS